MKKIIAGKVYNTATAEVIVCMYKGIPSQDFDYYNASIHRTTKGALFLYEEGGCRSKMGRQYGNNTEGSSDIKAISDTDAVEIIQEWHTQSYIDAKDITKAMSMLGIELEEA